MFSISSIRSGSDLHPWLLTSRLQRYFRSRSVLGSFGCSAAPLLLSSQLLFRSALRPVARFPCPPWMVVTPPTTTASADFCRFKKNDRPPRIRFDDFPQSLLRLRAAALVLFGRHCPMPAHPALHASLRSFCPSGPGFALRLPLHITSRSCSCLRLVVRRTNVHRRLSLPSHRPCRAYIGIGGRKRPPPTPPDMRVRIRRFGQV